MRRGGLTHSQKNERFFHLEQREDYQWVRWLCVSVDKEWLTGEERTFWQETEQDRMQTHNSQTRQRESSFGIRRSIDICADGEVWSGRPGPLSEGQRWAGSELISFVGTKEQHKMRKHFGLRKVMELLPGREIKSGILKQGTRASASLSFYLIKSG